MMKIIITGASGFVGQNLVPYLSAKGNVIQSLSLRTVDWPLENDADAIIHLAGKAHDTKNTAAAEAYFQVNRDLTIKLFDRFLQSPIRDFFYFSSVKAAADTVDGILTEEVQAQPFTPYGQSKLEAEQYLLGKTLPAGKRLFIIRPCMIHGPGNKGNLNLLYKVVQKGIPWPLAAFDNARSFLYVDNLCWLIDQMLTQSHVPSGVYNFADDDAVATNELVHIIGEVTGKKARLWAINAGLMSAVARLGDKLKLPLNSERLKKLTESYVVSNQKIKAALHIKSLPVTAKQGLKNTIAVFDKIAAR